MNQPPSTQSDSGLSIPFFLPHPSQQQTLRLLELPEDLLDIITSEHNNEHNDDGTKMPRTTVKLKSASPELTRTDALSAASSHDAKEGQLHLCTEDKAWAVRQVSTSNSVYVARWDDASVSDRIQTVSIGQDVEMADGDTDDHGTEASLCLRALAQPNTVLELLPVTQSVEDVMRMVMKLVPLYDALSNEDPRNQLLHQERYTTEQLYDEIPAPNSLIKEALDRLCCIEIPVLPKSRSHNTLQSSACFVPTAYAVLSVWERILETCVVHSLRLIDGLDLPRLVACVRNDCEEADREERIEAAMARQKNFYTITIPFTAIAQTLLYRTLPSLHIGRLASLTTKEAHNDTPQSPIPSLNLHSQGITSFLGQLLVLADIEFQHSNTSRSASPITTTPTSLAMFLSSWRTRLRLDPHLGESQNPWLPFITLSNLGPDFTYTISTDATATTTTWTTKPIGIYNVSFDPSTTTDPTMITFSIPHDHLAFPLPQHTAPAPTPATGQIPTSSASASSASGPAAAGVPGPTASATTGATSAATPATGKSAAGGGKNRKWHEKFAAQRRNV